MNAEYVRKYFGERLPVQIIDADGMPFHRIGYLTTAFLSSIKAVAEIDPQRRVVRTLRYIFKCAIRPQASIDWVSAVYDSHLTEYVSEHPRLLLKPHRPFICRQYCFTDRVVAVLDHYALAQKMLSVPIVKDISEGKTCVVTKFMGKSGSDEYSLTLTNAGKFGREGEICLSLHHGDMNTLICRLGNV